MSPGGAFRRTRLWLSAFRRERWTDTPRDRAERITGNVWLHLHPVFVRPRALRWTYTWGLGGLTFLLFFVLCFTGVALMFYYPPALRTVTTAGQDSAYWRPWARFLSNAHAWAAEGMILFALLHMARVFLTGAYKRPREFNWVVGCLLLAGTWFLCLSGKMIPWELVSIFSKPRPGFDAEGSTVLISGNGFYTSLDQMRRAGDFRAALFGGSLVGPHALVSYYTLHCVAAPLLFGFALMLHVWRVRKDGFSAAPLADGEEPKLETWPHLIRRESLAAAVALAALAALAFRGPVPEAGNSLHAPWWTVALQTLTACVPGWAAGRLVPALAVLGLASIPYLDVNPRGAGYYSARERPTAALVFALIAATWLALTLAPSFLESVDAAGTGVLTAPRWAAAAAAAVLVLGLRRKSGFSRLGPGRFAASQVLLLALLGLACAVAVRLGAGTRLTF